jgi:hypothetical protein
MHAEITQPFPNADKPYRFISKYPVKIHLEADIFNACDTNNIAVEVMIMFIYLKVLYLFIFIYFSNIVYPS